MRKSIGKLFPENEEASVAPSLKERQLIFEDHAKSTTMQFFTGKNLRGATFDYQHSSHVESALKKTILEERNTERISSWYDQEFRLPEQITSYKT